MQQPKELHPWTVSCSSRVLNNAPLKEHWIFDGPTSEVRRGTKSKALSGHHTRPKTTEDIKLMIKELMSQQIFHVKDVLQHSKFSNLHHSFTNRQRQNCHMDIWNISIHITQSIEKFAFVFGLTTSIALTHICTYVTACIQANGTIYIVSF